MKKVKIITVFLVLLFAVTYGSLYVSASQLSSSDTATVLSPSEIDIKNATREEIEDIGIGAMLEAGLISEDEANIMDVTPVVSKISEEEQTTDTENAAKSSVLEIVLLVLVIIAIVAIAILYWLCWCAGVFVIDEYNILSKFKKGKKE